MATIPPTDPLPPGTFTSILPEVEDLLELIYGIADGSGVINEDVIAKAKEVAARITEMKSAATALPGGHLGTDSVSAVTRILDEEAERKRATLRAFIATPTAVAERLASPVLTEREAGSIEPKVAGASGVETGDAAQASQAAQVVDRSTDEVPPPGLPPPGL